MITRIVSVISVVRTYESYGRVGGHEMELCGMTGRVILDSITSTFSPAPLLRERNRFNYPFAFFA